MDKLLLKEAQARFIPKIEDLTKHYNGLNIKRKKFVSDYNEQKLKKLAKILSSMEFPLNDDVFKDFIKDKPPLIQLLIASTMDKMDILEPELADFACKNITKIKEIELKPTPLRELADFVIKNCTSFVLLKSFCNDYMNDKAGIRNLFYNKFFNLFLKSCSKERLNIDIDVLLAGFQDCHIDKCNLYVEVINHIFSWIDSDKCNIIFDDNISFKPQLMEEIYDIFND